MPKPYDTDSVMHMRTQVLNFARDVSDVPLEDFLGRNRGFGFDFTPLKEIFQDYIGVAKTLNVSVPSELTAVFLPDLLDSIGHVSAAWAKLRDFSAPASDRPKEERQELMDQFAAECQSFFAAAAPVIAVIADKKATRDLSTRTEGLARREAESTAILDEMRSQQQKAAQTLDAIRADAQKVGVTAHAAHFADEAIYHRKFSGYWLAATTVMALSTVLFAGWNYYDARLFPQTLSPTANIQWIVAKLLLLSVLFTAAVWCARVYRAHRHNYVVNRHRQNALSSFETFVTSASDEQTKNAVLIQATQSIFIPQNTGYTSGESEATPPTQLIELVRTIAGGK